MEPVLAMTRQPQENVTAVQKRSIPLGITFEEGAYNGHVNTGRG